MIVGTSFYGRQADISRQLRLTTTEMQSLHLQLASGRKPDGLVGFAADADAFISAKQVRARSESYIRGIDVVSKRTDIYHQTVMRASTIALDAKTLFVKLDTIQQATDAGMVAQINSWMQQLTVALNARDGGRFVFAGSDFGTAPVTDLAALPDWIAPAAPPTMVSAPAVPDYSAVPNPQTWAIERQFIDDGLAVDYGITASDPAFQRLILAMRYAKSAMADPANFVANMQQAKNLATQAIADLGQLQGRNGMNQALLESTRTAHQSDMDALEVIAGKIQNVSVEEVALNIKTLQVQLEASYATTRTILGLSLANYLR